MIISNNLNGLINLHSKCVTFPYVYEKKLEGLNKELKWGILYNMITSQPFGKKI